MDTAFYSKNAEELVARYNGVAFEAVHASWIDLLPKQPGLVLDVGAGSGRDANWLRSKGHEVVAVEPTRELRSLAEKASLPGVRWIDDSLPALSVASKLNLTFDLILVSAVWMHVAPGERSRAFRKLAKLNKDDPHPHWLDVLLFHSHPPVGQRLAMAEEVAKRGEG